MDNGGGAPPPFQANLFSQPSSSSGPAAGASSSSTSTSSFSRPPSSTPTLAYSGTSRGGPAGRGGRGQFASGGRGSAPTRGGGASKPFANKSVTFNNAGTLAPSTSSGFAQETLEENEGSQGGSSPFSAFQPGGSSAFAAPISSSSSSTSGYTTPVPDAESSVPTSTWLSQAAAPSPAASYAPPAGQHDGASATSEAVDTDGGEDSRKKRFARPAGSNRFLEMKAQRPLLRQKYIDQGILPDPEKPQQLSAATRFTGSCMEMCPEFEREEREFQGEGDELEVYPGTTKLDPALAVKIYRRPAAGRELPLPEDVRPPPVLKRTLDYLFHTLLPSSPNSEQLAHVQGFIWNRTRAIRQDFIVQGQAGPLTIECHERIARWHILGLHWRGGGVDKQGQPREWPSDLDPWSEQQELEQLAKTLTSLNEFYDDLRMSTGQSSPNEAEFRAYHLILNLYDPEVLRNVELLPEEVFDAPILQTAIRLRGYAQRSNRGGTSRANALNTDAPMNFFSRFFAEIRAADQRVPYLLACMLENKFAPIREGGLKALCFNYNKAHRGPSLSFVKEALGADTEEQVEEWAKLCGIEVQREGDGEPALKLNKQVELTKTLPQSFSILVESKRGKYNSRQIIDGIASGAAPLLLNAGPATTQSTTHARPSSLNAIPSTSSTVKSSRPAAAESTPPSSGFSFGNQTEAKTQPRPGAFAPSPAFGASTTPSLGAFSSLSSPSSNAFGKAALPSKTQMNATASPFQPSQPMPQSNAFSAPFAGFKTEDTKSHKEGTSVPPAAPFSPPSSSPFAPPPTQFGAPKPSSTTKQTFFSSPALSAIPTDTSKASTPSSSFEPPTRVANTPAAPTPASLPASAKEVPQLALPSPETTSASAARETRIRQEKREKVVQRALSQLIADQATSVAKQALQKEEGRRRAHARQAFLGSMSEKLMRGLQQDVIAKLAGDLAANSLADESRRRCVLRSHFARWQIRLELRQERERQKARLDDVRAQVLEKGLLDQSLSASRGGLRAALMLPNLSILSVSAGSAPAHRSSKSLVQSRSSIQEDDQLRTSYSQSKAERSHLWEQGTFLTYIASHMASLVSRWRPVEMGGWSVLLSLPDDDSASMWLKHKFGLCEERPQKTIPIAPDVEVRGELVDDPAEVEHLDTGLLVFVLSADLAATGQGDDEEQIWELEADRLRALEENEALSASRFSPRLLVIDWRTGARSTEVANRLGLDASAQPFWKNIAVCNLGGAALPDELFSSAVATLLKDVSMRPRKVEPSLAEVVMPLRHPWSNAAVTIEGLLARLPTGLAASTSVSLEVFAAMLSLANHTLEAVSQASDHEYSDKDLLLPTSKLSSSLQSLNGLTPTTALAQASWEVIDECERMHGEENLYLTRGLIGQAQQQVGRRFPFAALLENLLQSRLDLLAQGWSARLADEEAGLGEKLAEDARYVQQGAERIVAYTAEKVRGLQEQQASALRDSRRRKEPEVDEVISSSGNEKKRSARSSAGSASPFTPRKRSRSFGTSPRGIAGGSPAVPVFVGTPDVQRLRGLIASAKGLLAGQTV